MSVVACYRPSPIQFGYRLLLAVSTLAACDAYRQIAGPPQCDAINIGGPQGPLVVGDTLRLRASLRDAQNRPVTCVGAISAYWTSSAPSIVSVNGGGLMRALAEGQSVITARYENTSRAVTIRVVRNP